MLTTGNMKVLPSLGKSSPILTHALACLLHVNLWKKRLGCVPPLLWRQTSLETLVLADNDLFELSEEIGSLKRLRMLDLGHNKLTRVPDALGALDSLTDFLYLHDNRLASLPPALASLTKLRYLNISDNAFELLPECVTRMSRLLELRVAGNQLTTLPDSINRLTCLRELHLRNNQLRRLPQSIGELHELRQIDLRGNPLEYLPDSIAGLPRLDKLDLRWVTTLQAPAWLAALEARGCAVYR